MPNTPDDWSAYWRYCERCRVSWHASEGGCECRPCEVCGSFWPWQAMVDGELCVECVEQESNTEEE